MKNSFVAQFALLLIFLIFSFTSFSQIKIGVFADCQYCDCETAGTRFYRNSLQKLDDCINHFNNNEELAFVVGLGDLIDRGFSGFDSVNLILAKSNKEVYHVIGNHDLSVEKNQLENVPEKLNLNETWYSLTKNGWRFIFLNGNDITFHSNNKEKVKEAEKITSILKAEGKPNYFDWNGGIGSTQLKWFEKSCKKQETKIKKSQFSATTRSCRLTRTHFGIQKKYWQFYGNSVV
ncbi:MAG: metallophosphoesterase [Draconibacterium sp.]|nr:metallophosphoesterase [Draconibacterium sp.]